MDRMTRRSFIQIGAAAGTILTTAGFVPRTIYADEETPAIKYRDLGKTGWKVSEIGFGAMNMRDPELVRAAVEAGINIIDTAHGYQNGASEEAVGQAIHGVRDDVFLITKVHAGDRDNILPMVETSLKRLQTDHIDLLLHHGIHERGDLASDDLKRQFEETKQKGMTRFIGLSTHTPEIMLDEAVTSHFWEAVELAYNYLSPPSVTEAVKRAREAGIAIIAMKNLLNINRPLFSLSRGRTPLDDIRAEKTPGTTPQQALIKWVLNNPYVDTTIPGMTSFEHIEDDLAVMNMDFTFDTEKLLQGYIERFQGRYCRGFLGCNGCEGQCPRGVRVSEINRCLGYAYGYRNIELAYENYQRLPRNNRLDQCDDCSECMVKCVHGLDMTAQIARARSLFM